VTIPSRFLEILRCPVTGARLHQAGGALIADRGPTYRITEDGIPVFAESPSTDDAQRQQAHYDRIAKQYLENLAYPQTEEYTKYLDAALVKAASLCEFGETAELCCGGGDGVALFKSRMHLTLGLDISIKMLKSARKCHSEGRFLFVQGDATRLPMAQDSVDTVVMLGGIHHVNNRMALFREIARILKPGGRFLFREPVSDFVVWRWLRAIIYKLSPTLDEKTERPLLYDETQLRLKSAGLRLIEWKTFGFLGYCVLMNSDVLVFNRILRFLPGIRALTRFACLLDDLVLRMPGLGGMGLIVVGVAEKAAPKEA
jgi:ubiquinone/menaquinone biosynthesis C-methylase UbiE